MKKLQFKIFLLLFAIFYFLVASPLWAAELSFNPSNQELMIGEYFKIDLFLNTGGEEINALEGEVAFGADLLELKEISDGNSLVNFWIARPREDHGKIVFSGIVARGYSGSQGTVFSMIFQSKKVGRGMIQIVNSKTLRSDGAGTPAKLAIKNFEFAIRGEPFTGQPRTLYPPDREPPEAFAPEIARNPALFGGQWFVVFAAQDKGSGLDHYEVWEKDKWFPAASPSLLKDQSRRSLIKVKAVDRAGNARIAELGPSYELVWWRNYQVWALIIGVIIVYFVWRKIRSKRR